MPDPMPLPWAHPAPSHSRLLSNPAPVQVGTSFSPGHATYLGLDWKDAYMRLEAMHFKVIRLSAYWDQVDVEGYDQLDWLMKESQASGQPVVLSVGMKGLGWPEFFIPRQLQPKTEDGGDVSQDGVLRAAVLDFVQETTSRYKDNPALLAWQVENEPLNPAGPHRWYIGRELLAKEVAIVKELDSRPVIVNAFGHFNMLFDRTSNRSGFDLGALLGFDSNTAEAQSLGLLGRDDILGLDVYTEIGYNFLGHEGVSHAGSDWAAKAGHWRSVALRQGKQAWITEAQAEPWEASINTYGDPKSTVASDIPARFASIRAQGFSTILLWGAEYWLWRADNGDHSWLDAVTGVLAANAAAPPVSV
ncbi:MAG: hypothetical protein M3Z98_09055 [Candidatus Dormibacteraeota bacterium]|nr:hypothetical protein [Candidatus Dormibacteraeota bacterium]